MIVELILAIVQAATEFLPVSSSGHLVLLSNLFNFAGPRLFFFTMLHLASLIAVLVFTRKEIAKLLTFEKKYRKMWIYLIVATIPAALVGYFFSDFFGLFFDSYLSIGVAFMITGFVLLSTRGAMKFSKLGVMNAFAIGVAQVAALLPGISRSGMTISSGLFLGLDREEATKFSFLLFIPLSIGAFVLEFGEAYFSWTLVLAFLITFVLSLFFLRLLMKIVKRDKLWLFSFYCFLIGLVSLKLYFG